MTPLNSALYLSNPVLYSETKAIQQLPDEMRSTSNTLSSVVHAAGDLVTKGVTAVEDEFSKLGRFIDTYV